jgi:hypothetical protein
MDRANDPELSTIHFFMAALDGWILDMSKGDTAHPKTESTTFVHQAQFYS